MTIKQPVINTFKRVGIDYEAFDNTDKTGEAVNRFTGVAVKTTELIAELVKWVYATNDAYERGDFSVRNDDFDRVRYFILEQDSEVYSACID